MKQECILLPSTRTTRSKNCSRTATSTLLYLLLLVPRVTSFINPLHARPESSIFTYRLSKLWVDPKTSPPGTTSAEKSGPSSGTAIQDQVSSSSSSKNTSPQSLNSTATDPNQQQFNASDSFGSLLMQMQKKEEELGVAVIEQDVLDLDHLPSEEEEEVPKDDLPAKEAPVTPAKDLQQKESKQQQREPQQPQEISTMDLETARELDSAVRTFPESSSRDDLLKGIRVQPLSPLYRSILQQRQDDDATTALSQIEPLPLLSQPEHYLGRIGRDMRMLALKIVASTESVGQWRVFCQENAGLYPILETIREGARSIHQQQTLKKKRKKKRRRRLSEQLQQDQSPEQELQQPWLGVVGIGVTGDVLDQEQIFRAACSACRAVRDLCAISPEVAAVVTDTVLRANAAWHGGLMDDFCTMLRYANEYTEQRVSRRQKERWDESFLRRRRNQREVRLRCKLYVGQLLLAMAVASDDAVISIRSTKGLTNAVLACSSYARIQRTRRWLRYPGEMAKWLWRSRNYRYAGRRPFLEANSVSDDLQGSVQRTSNQILAAIGRNRWIPKTPGQKGLRILALDGGGSRGMVAVTTVRCLMEKIGSGCEPADSFDIIAGTSTGGIIAFLTGLKQETSAEAVERYNQLIKQIFVKSALSTPLMLFTTATYDESHFMGILSNILGDDIMLDSRADPTGPLVFAVTSKMSSTPTHISLFRNYNYGSGELADTFTVNPDKARKDLGLKLELEHPLIRTSYYERKRAAEGSAPGVRVTEGSRHPGSFRVLQRFALRASTAAPTVFKPVMMGGEIYADGGIVSSNPSAVAIHEARTLFPDIPIEMVVSIGTGGFVEQKSAPKIGWDGIIGQIVNSATDGEQVHHILEDILSDSAVLGRHRKSAISQTKYYRFNPILGMPDDFPIDVTDPSKLARLRQIARDYMDAPEQQRKIEEISDMILCRQRWGKRIRDIFRR